MFGALGTAGSCPNQSVCNYQALIDWAKAHGLTTSSSTSRLLLGVNGTVAQINAALHVTFQNDQRRDGSVFYAPDRDLAPLFACQGVFVGMRLPGETCDGDCKLIDGASPCGARSSSCPRPRCVSANRARPLRDVLIASDFGRFVG